jgi:hypothetical protein
MVVVVGSGDGCAASSGGVDDDTTATTNPECAGLGSTARSTTGPSWHQATPPTTQSHTATPIPDTPTRCTLPGTNASDFSESDPASDPESVDPAIDPDLPECGAAGRAWMSEVDAVPQRVTAPAPTPIAKSEPSCEKAEAVMGRPL